VSNIAVAFPFDLLAGAPVGGLAIMGDDPITRRTRRSGSPPERRLPGSGSRGERHGLRFARDPPNLHVTYTHVGDQGPVDLAKAAASIGAGRNFASSGAFCIATVLGKGGKGTAMETPI